MVGWLVGWWTFKSRNIFCCLLSYRRGNGWNLQVAGFQHVSCLELYILSKHSTVCPYARNFSNYNQKLLVVNNQQNVGYVGESSIGYNEIHIMSTELCTILGVYNNQWFPIKIEYLWTAKNLWRPCPSSLECLLLVGLRTVFGQWACHRGVYIHIYTYIHIYIYAYINTYISIWIYIQMHIYIIIHIFMYILYAHT